jgi:hypothetical protein
LKEVAPLTDTLTASLLVGAPSTPQKRSTDLLTIANVVDMADGAWEMGVQWDMDSCGEVGSYDGICMADGETKDFTGLAVGEGLPFVVHAGVECGMFSRDREVAAARARLAAHEATEVEKRLVDRYIVNPSAQVETDAKEMPAALGHLEDLIAEYGYEGIIQMPPSIAALAAQKGLLMREGGRTVTYLGTPIATGHGYTRRMRVPVGNGTGTDVTPTEGQGWIWVTGAVELMRGPVKVSEAVNTATNVRMVLAERIYVPKIDCLIGGALVKAV